jgi:hypothetical protein
MELALQELQELKKYEQMRTTEFGEKDQTIRQLEDINADKSVKLLQLQKQGKQTTKDIAHIREQLRDRSNYLATQHWIIKYLLQKNKDNESEINSEIAAIQQEAKTSDICAARKWATRKERLLLVEKILSDSKAAILSPTTSKRSRSPRPAVLAGNSVLASGTRNKSA